MKRKRTRLQCEVLELIRWYERHGEQALAQLRDEVRELLYLAIQELSYCHSAENLEQVTSEKGKWIVDEGMKLLSVKDLSEDSLRAALASPERGTK